MASGKTPHKTGVTNAPASSPAQGQINSGGGGGGGRAGMEYNDGIASRVQKRRTLSEYTAARAEKRLKVESPKQTSIKTPEKSMGQYSGITDHGLQRESTSQDRNQVVHVLEQEMGILSTKVEAPVASISGYASSVEEKATPTEPSSPHPEDRHEDDRPQTQSAGPSEVELVYKRLRSNVEAAPINLDPASKQWLKLSGLPVLELIADQLLELISTHTAADLINIQSADQEGHWRLWNTLSSHFAATKWTYGYSLPRSAGFTLSNGLFDGVNASDDSRRKLNIATAISTLLRPPDHTCAFLEEQFIDIFVPAGTSLSEWQAELLYTIKAQVYIAELAENEVVSLEKVDRLFGISVENVLRAGNGTRPLSAGENRLLEFCDWARNEHIDGDPSQITSNHDWNGVVCRALPHVRQRIRAVLGHQDEPIDVLDPVLAGPSSVETMFNNQPPVASGDMLQGDDGQPYGDDSFGEDEMVRVAALAAHAALTGQNMSDPYESPMSFNDYSPHVQQPDPFQLSYNQNLPYAQELSAQALASASADAQHLASTREQYERARLAATAKAQARIKTTAPTPSQRRPWTQEEENALMTGLDRVQGPHWSQILAMYGAGGTISEVLKDRNQVQLKDKARNLKLFFLKSGHAVPHYLKHVTGELKTRAPATMAKNEARERLEESAGEDQAAVNAINVLAAGGRQGYGTASPQPDRSYTPLGGMQDAMSNAGPTPTGFTAANGYSVPQQEQHVQEDFMANAIQQALAAAQNTSDGSSPARVDGGRVAV